MWGKFEALEDGKADKIKRSVLLVGIKEALPNVFIQVTNHSARYELRRTERAVIASFTYMPSDSERRGQTGTFQARSNSNKVSEGLDASQCACFLKRKHRWRQCCS